MKRNGTVRLGVLISPAMIISAMVLISSSISADWIPGLGMSEGASPHDSQLLLYGAYRGIETDFSWDLTNNQQATVEISQFIVNFDWWTSGGGINIVTQSTSIPAGGSHKFVITWTIPQSVSLGDHKAWIDITGQKMGDPSSSVLSTFSIYNVKDIPALQVTLTPSGALEVGNNLQLMADVTGGMHPFHYTWTYGDGSTYSYDTTDPYSTDCIARHAYSTAGTYTVTVTVTDSSLTPQSETKAVTITIGGSTVINPFGGLLIPIILIGVIVAVVVVVIILMVRKPKNPVQNQPSPGQNMNPPGLT